MSGFTFACDGCRSCGRHAWAKACVGRTACRATRTLESGPLAFLDEEEQTAASDLPERPRARRSGGPRAAAQAVSRPATDRGRRRRRLPDPARDRRSAAASRLARTAASATTSQDIGTIMQESQQRGEEFFTALEGEGGLERAGARGQISAVRSASTSLLDRAEDLDAPDQMSEAQSASHSVPEARAATRWSRSPRTSARQPPTRSAADAIEVDHDADGVPLRERHALDPARRAGDRPTVAGRRGRRGPGAPAGNFMPEGDPTEYLDQTSSVTELLTGLSGDDDATTAGIRGLELVQSTSARHDPEPGHHQRPSPTTRARSPSRS